MGTEMVPAYAILTLAYLKKNLYKIIKTEFIRSGKRYLDDYFIFWKCQWSNINNLHLLSPKPYNKILHGTQL